MEKLGLDRLVSIFFFLFDVVDAARMARMARRARIIYVLCVEIRTAVIVFNDFPLTGNNDSPVSDDVCEQHTASFTCHTRNLSRVHVAPVLEPSSGQDRSVVVLASPQKSFHLIHVSPHLA